MVIIHPNRRDGGIMKCFLDEECDSISIGNETVLENCLNVIGRISGIFQLKYPDYLRCPNLPPLIEEDFLYMKYHLSRNKAITFDGFSENWFLKSERLDILRDLWTRECL